MRKMSLRGGAEREKKDRRTKKAKTIPYARSSKCEGGPEHCASIRLRLVGDVNVRIVICDELGCCELIIIKINISQHFVKLFVCLPYCRRETKLRERDSHTPGIHYWCS